jgi:rhomboid protease GluP
MEGDNSEKAVTEEAQVALIRSIMERPVRATWVLLWLNLGIWFLGFLYGNSIGIESANHNNEQIAFYTALKINRLIGDGDWWRIISSQFVHLNVMHIFFNGYGLYALGPIVERFYGTRRFVLVYLLSGTLGAIASFFLVELPSGGASGAIYGLVGVIIALGWRYQRYLPEKVVNSFTKGLIPWVVIGIGVGFLESVPMDNAAHIGGLCTGLVGAFAFDAVFHRGPEHEFRNTVVRWAFIGAIGLVAAAGGLWFGEIMDCTSSREAYLACYPEIAEQLGSYFL